MKIFKLQPRGYPEYDSSVDAFQIDFRKPFFARWYRHLNWVAIHRHVSVNSGNGKTLIECIPLRERSLFCAIRACRRYAREHGLGI